MNHCNIEYRGEEEFEIEGSPTICRQLLVNLIINAGRAIDHQGHILLELHRHENNAVLKVHDDGPGIPEEERNNVLKAFYTTQTKGTGLGLTSIKVYVDVLGGSMDISDSELGGACFRIELPL
ncbi:MAG: ATP-binding protein [candidate division KSB1 bacterium]|nr:ATP-binding protein [candidate division KSB1 bacterium]